MGKKRILLISGFIATAALSLWMGIVFGTNMGIDVGKAFYHNGYVREIQITLNELENLSEKHADEYLQRWIEVSSDLASAAGKEPEFGRAIEELNELRKEQNK